MSFRYMTFRRLAAVLLISSSWSAGAADAPALTLEDGAWEMISPPADFGDATLGDLFGGDLPVGGSAYGSRWVVFRTVAPSSPGAGVGYERVPLDGTLEPGEGYWIIQATGQDVTVALPQGAAAVETVRERGCPSIAGCTATALKMTGDGRDYLWNLTGLPIVEPVPLARTAVMTTTATGAGAAPGPCDAGCDFAAAAAADIMHDEMWRYVGSGSAKAYEKLTQAATLEPWQAVWVPVLGDAAGRAPRWVRGIDVPDQRPDLANAYTLEFEENFDGLVLNPAVWNTGALWGPYVTINNEQQMYVDTLGAHPDSAYDPFVFTGDGTMKIVAAKVGENGVELPARPDPDDPIWNKLDYNRNDTPRDDGNRMWDAADVDYLSGILTSYDAFRFAHGYAEIRAKVATGPGLWPAFWLLPSQYVESVPEIDVMEHLGQNANEVYHTYHFFHRNRQDPARDWQARRTPTIETVGPDFSEDFHTYGVSWAPGQLVYYVDGMETYRVNDGDPSFWISPDGTQVVETEEPIQIPRQAMFLIANLAVGGNWPGPPTSGTEFPAEYEIDYIRAWKKRVDVPVNLDQYTLAFGDEFDGDALDASKWNTRFIWSPFLPINCEQQYYVDALGADRDLGYSPFDVSEEHLGESGGYLTITAAKAGAVSGANVPPPLPASLPPSAQAGLDRQLAECPGVNEAKGRERLYEPRTHTSGMITSYDSFQFIGGYAEIRAKIPAGDGLWPAFWLLNGYYVRRNPEIDIMEIIGEDPRRLHTTYHRIADRPGESGKMEQQGSSVLAGDPDPGIGLADGFHTYAVQWKKGLIVWYLDGEEVWRLEEDRVSDQLMYVIANLAVGGNFNSKAVDDAALPAQLVIDHIRVYQEKALP